MRGGWTVKRLVWVGRCPLLLEARIASLPALPGRRTERHSERNSWLTMKPGDSKGGRDPSGFSGAEVALQVTKESQALHLTATKAPGQWLDVSVDRCSTLKRGRAGFMKLM